MTDLHVKYRPEIFEDVLGQEHIVKSLTDLRDKNTWPHAYLLEGGSGLGKTTVGRIIARDLKCEASNLVEVDAATYSGIENVRQLTSTLAYKGFGKNPTRVFIIDECHSLSKTAWQGLLKSVEEPPDHVYFIFCTTESDKVPKTIRTRCTIYNFRSVSVDDLTDLILYVTEEEKFENLTEKMLVRIAQKAEGSPRAALTLLGKCQGVKDMEELEQVLESADDNKSIIELCRLLAGIQGGTTWKKCVKLINNLEELPPESIRLVVINYMTKVLSTTTEDGKAMKILNVLDAFKGPWYNAEKKAPLFLAIGSIVFEEENDD